MGKKKKIFFPSQDGQVPPFINNVDDKLNAGGLAVKYGIVAGDLTKVAGFKTDIPSLMNDAALAFQTSQQLNEKKDKTINDAKLFLNKMGQDMQDHTSFDPADLEAMGFTVVSTPPDPNTAKPKISGATVLPDKNILDWVKSLYDGVEAFRSRDNGATFQDMGKDLRSPFEDTDPNLLPGTPEVRIYKFRYLLKDKLVGLESDPVRLVCDIG